MFSDESLDVLDIGALGEASHANITARAGRRPALHSAPLRFVWLPPAREPAFVSQRPSW
jgi:hypothetical protein